MKSEINSRWMLDHPHEKKGWRRTSKMKAIVLSHNKLIKIRYIADSELPDLLKELRKIPNLNVDVNGYVG